MLETVRHAVTPWRSSAAPGGAPGFTLKKKDFFKNAPAIAVFAVGGTFVSALVFGLLTYFLVIIHVVSRSALGPAPLTECMLYGAGPGTPAPSLVLCLAVSPAVKRNAWWLGR